MIVMTKQEFCEKILEAEQAMYHTAYAILKNDSDCADAVQEAIFKAYKSLDKLKNPEYFKTWIIRILVNTCYSQLKSRRYTDDIENISEPAAEDDYSKTELMLEIASLDEKYRVPLILYGWLYHRGDSKVAGTYSCGGAKEDIPRKAYAERAA